MKVSRRQVVMSGGAWALLPLTACDAHRPAARSLDAPGAAPQPDRAAVHAPATTSAALTSGAALTSSTAITSDPATASAVSSPAAVSHTARAAEAPNSCGALTCERIVAKIGRNHGHDFPIAADDVVRHTSQSFDLRGGSDHTHTIELSASELAALGRGEVLRKQTERGGGNAHRHRVLLRCEPLVLPPEMTSACSIVVAGKDDHEFVIPEAHVRAGIERQYDIQGVAGHTHVLTVTAADFARIAAGESVDLKSGQGLGHFHHVYIRYPVA